MQGIKRQVLRIIVELYEADKEAISKRLVIPSEYAGFVCDSLVEEGFLIKTARGRYAPRIGEEVIQQILEIIKELKEANKKAIGERIGIAADEIADICDLLVRDGYLVKTPRETYMPAKEEKQQVLEVLKELKEADKETIAEKMGISSEYAGLLCDHLVEKEKLIKTPQKKYAFAERDTLRVLSLIRNLKEASKEMVSRKMAVTSGYTSLLCDSLVKDGYLVKTPQQKYTLAEGMK